MVDQEDDSLARALYRTDPGFRLLVDDLFRKLDLPPLERTDSLKAPSDGDSNG